MSRWAYPKPEWERVAEAAKRAAKKERATRERRVKRWLAKFDKEHSFHSDNWRNESETAAEVWSTIGQWDEDVLPGMAWKASSYAEFRSKVLEQAHACVAANANEG
jgi:hypothetical protein